MTTPLTDGLPERFLRHVLQTDTCWLWQGRKTPKGYGRWENRKGSTFAHRTLWEHVNGPVPVGLELDHLCRVRHCVNPNHLEAVTHQENINRAVRQISTHCINGHEFTPENTYRPPGCNYRMCRECMRRHSRKWKARLHSQQEPT